MANRRMGGTSAQAVGAGRKAIQRFRPPMTTTVTGSPYPVAYWGREQFTPLAIGLKEPTTDYLSVYASYMRHINDFGTFRADFGYNVLYTVPEGYQARCDLQIVTEVGRAWVSVAVIEPGDNMGAPTPAKSYLVYQAMIHDDKPLFLRGLMLEPGVEIRVAGSQHFVYWNLTGIITTV